MGGEDGGGLSSHEIKETTVDVRKLEETVVQYLADASDRKNTAATTDNSGTDAGVEEQVVVDVVLDDGSTDHVDDDHQMTTSDISEEEEEEEEVVRRDDDELPWMGFCRSVPAHQLRRIKDVIQGPVDHVFDVYCRGEYLWDRGGTFRHDHGRSGFYKVPVDMRRRAVREVGFLYDPKYVNFRNINDLLQMMSSSSGSSNSSALRRQLSHYCYHLHSYTEGSRHKIESLMYQWYIFKLSEENTIQAAGSSTSATTADHPVGLDRHFFYVDHISRPHSFGLLFATCFLGDLFSRSHSNGFSASADPECAHLWVSELWADLLLLENQIPFFRIACPDLDALMVLYRNTCSSFRAFLPLCKKKYLHLQDQTFVDGRFLHVLHFVHEMMLPKYWRDQYQYHRPPPSSLIISLIWACLCFPLHYSSCLDDLVIIRSSSGRRRLQEAAPPSRMEPIPTATRLQLAGVKFVPAVEEGFNVEFKRGVLKLPRLHVSQSTKKVLMNLIAWEMCHGDAPKYFINYAIFMDHLINTAKDVEILIHSRVFEHSLATDDEVAAIFNGLGQDLVYTKPQRHHARYDIFPTLTVDINKYYQSRPNKWFANLMQEYFKSPWTIISFIAAFFLILLTTVQTFFSVFAYVRPPQ